MADTTGRRSSQANSLEDLFNLLSSKDAAWSQQAKTVIIDGLINSARAGETSSWLQNHLIDYYMRTGCENAAEILTKIQDSQARFLFDKINASLSNGNTCLQAVKLLGNIARSQPSWLYRIGNNAAVPTLLKCLKSQQDAEVLIGGILTLTILLPSMPTLVKPYMPEMVEIYIRLASWRIKKPGHIPDLFLQHLLIAANVFFQRLYGMFPCTCMSLLKAFCKSKANRDIFDKALQPLLGQLRFHPMLVTSDCDEESQPDRWKKLEPYEIVVECSKFASGIYDDRYNENYRESAFIPRRCPHTYQVVSDGLPDRAPNNTWRQNSSTTAEMNDINRISRSNSNSASIVSKTDTETDKQPEIEKVDASLEHATVATVTTNKLDKIPLVAFRDSHELWSPSLLLDVDSPPTSPDLNRNNPTRISTPGKSSETHNRLVDSPIHAAPPDTINTSNFTNSMTKFTHQTNISKEILSPTKQNDSLDQEKFTDFKYSTPKRVLGDSQDDIVINQSATDNIKQTADDQALIHRKISEGKLRKKVSTAAVPVRKELGLASNTEVQDPADNKVIPNRIYSLTSMDLFTSDNINQEDAHGLPDIHSWPPNAYLLNDSKLKEDSTEDILTDNLHHSFKPKESPFESSQSKIEDDTATDNKDFTSSSAVKEKNFTNTDSESTADLDSKLAHQNASLSSYINLMDAALRSPIMGAPLNQRTASVAPVLNDSFQDFSPKTSSDCHSWIYPSFTSFEEYLTLASEIHSEELKRIPLVDRFDTTWNYFGGSAPADEVTIFKGQTRLLLNQLLFERYQTEMYAQRNRQLVGRTYRLNALEEECLAMKDQLRFQEAEIHHLKLYLKLQEEEQRRVIENRETWESDMKSRVRTLNNEKLQLQRRIDQLSDKLSVVLSQSDRIKQELSMTKAELFDATSKLKRLDQLEIKNKAVIEMNDRLKNELVLLGEYCNQQLESNENSLRASLLKAKQQVLSYDSELSARNEAFQKQDIQLESMKCQITDLENRIKSKELALKLEKDMLKESKDIHASEIEVIERKYKSLQRICRKYESYILKLHSQLEIIQKESGLKISADSDTQLSADSLQTTIYKEAEAI
ncbi:uncharacterized protein TRIADDRAFT_53459 [Trichoplax adhaerens]|uniref:Hamartin n=1 Tax=Trichoplax adhaerens TaxID=10228 RepID=B3RPA1_TRIAD|nr:hypothetical protein TRIADDRAFT_53459 [Trichoplax adhaerens]EDV27600.1 hypothetical protein TRIADDRAFT_53459 [Trichoplax adhaerens]|eukprot:XP_002109434.1 hypothetical protein TRIADDRAFT_53459 [Trichoplax adhaerens]